MNGRLADCGLGSASLPAKIGRAIEIRVWAVPFNCGGQNDRFNVKLKERVVCATPQFLWALSSLLKWFCRDKDNRSHAQASFLQDSEDSTITRYSNTHKAESPPENHATALGSLLTLDSISVLSLQQLAVNAKNSKIALLRQNPSIYRAFLRASSIPAKVQNRRSQPHRWHRGPLELCVFHRFGFMPLLASPLSGQRQTPDSTTQSPCEDG